MLLRSKLRHLLSLFVLLLAGPALVGATNAPESEKPRHRLKHWIEDGARRTKKRGAAPETGGRTAPEMGGGRTAPEMGGATAPEMGVATSPEIGVPSAPEMGGATAPEMGVATSPEMGVPSAPEMGAATAPEIGGGLAPAVGNWQDAGSMPEGIKKTGFVAKFLCSPQENMRATKADALGRQGIAVKELCIMGVTKFGWACLLTIVGMVTLILCVPLILAVSRRRPPGTSLISMCGSKPPLQFRPPANVPSYSTMNPGTGPSYASAQSQTLLTQPFDDPQSVLSKPVDFPGESPASKPVFNIDDDIRFP